MGFAQPRESVIAPEGASPRSETRALLETVVDLFSSRGSWVFFIIAFPIHLSYTRKSRPELVIVGSRGPLLLPSLAIIDFRQRYPQWKDRI
jgi:hypothetical protein